MYAETRKLRGAAWASLLAGAVLSCGGCMSAMCPAKDIGAGRVLFRLEAPEAEEVVIVGSFNRWDPKEGAMRNGLPGGVWKAELAVPAGTHQYVFLVDGEPRLPDGAEKRVPDGFGGENAVLVIDRHRDGERD